MKKKNSKKSSKQLIIALAILATFSVLFAGTKENKIFLIQNDFVALPEMTDQVLALPLLVKSISNESAPVAPLLEEVVTSGPVSSSVPTQLAICDHNGDGSRNLSDVALFAGIKDTLSLSEIAEYAQNNQDDTWCAAQFRRLPVCDHNGDTLRNLSDVALFAACQDTFDADGNGVHDLNDISLYTTNHQDNYFCANNFVCQAQTSSTEPRSETVVSGGSSLSSALEICDHNNDGYRNLVDVAFFANCKNTFDADGNGVHDLNDISLYTANHQDNYFCTNNFVCQAQASSAPAQVLGEKISNCNIDTDITGQTQWADGSLIRGCDMKVYRIENQSKRHIVSLSDLFKYIGQRIYNVADEIVALF